VAQQAQESMVKSERDALICEHLPLVKQVAQRFYVGSSSPVEMNDLMQYGVMGLIDATEKYDHERGTSFQSYARFRIKGSILDGLRGVDFVPRSVRRKRRELVAATHRVEQELGGAATDEEIAEAMDIDLEELRRIRESCQGVNLSSVEEMADRGCEFELSDALGRHDENSGPEAETEAAELRVLMTEAIDELPEKERLVLSLYYYESCTMREVGDILGVTESRVSQLHAKAVKRLQCRLREPLGMAC
jgi:RNA polymerase sigma factor for flagellar operon FliA